MKPPVSRGRERAALLQDLETALRMSSAQGTLFSQAVADRLGIASSDLECMDILQLEGRVTAGRLAEVTGLTSGAITGLIDRLERVGLVRRERDESDRRKVFVAVVPDKIAEVAKLYEPMQRAMQKAWAAYSDDELKLLLRFASESHATLVTLTTDLRARTAPDKKKPRG